MAAGGPVTRLTEEATCPICLEYFRHPMSLPCGHNFCHTCIARYWKQLSVRATCPQCREHFYRKGVKPNRQLANVVELVKELEEAKLMEGKAGLCEKHQEPLKLFCKDEEVPVCMICDKGKEHQGHHVVPIGEAAKEYQEKIKESVENLKKQQETLLEEKKAKEERIKLYCTKLNMVGDRTTCALRNLNKFLEEKDFFWQDYLEDLQREIMNEEHRNVVILSEEISRLKRLITKIEEICPHSPSEYLQKTKILLSKNDSITQTADLPPSLQEKFENTFQKFSALENAVEIFKESVKQILFTDSPKQVLNKVCVTLDPDTASPFLVLLEDLTTVKWQCRRQELPDNPERFDWEPYVLGQEKFASGRHCWEVVIEEEETQKAEKPRWVIFQRLKLRLQCSKWAVGVARGSVKRTGFVKLNPDNGIWAVGKPLCDKPGQFLAFTAPKPSPVSLKSDPKKICVDLQYKEGHVAFSDADSNELIFTFTERSFLGEAIRPFFHVGSWGIILKCEYLQNETYSPSSFPSSIL